MKRQWFAWLCVVGFGHFAAMSATAADDDEVPDLDIVVGTNLQTTEAHREAYVEKLYEEASQCFRGVVRDHDRKDLPDEDLKVRPARYRLLVEHRGTVWVGGHIALHRFHGQLEEVGTRQPVGPGELWDWTILASQSGTITFRLLKWEENAYKALAHWSTPVPGLPGYEAGKKIEILLGEGSRLGMDALRGGKKCPFTLPEAQAKARAKMMPGDFGDIRKAILCHLFPMKVLRAQAEPNSRQGVVQVQLINRSPWPLEELRSAVSWVQRYARAPVGPLGREVGPVYRLYRAEIVFKGLLLPAEKKVQTTGGDVGRGFRLDGIREVDFEHSTTGIPKRWPKAPRAVATRAFFAPRRGPAWVSRQAARLKSQDEDVRRRAASALSHVAAEMVPKEYELAIPALIESLEDIPPEDPGRVFSEVAWALARVSQKALPYVLDALRHQKAGVRLAAVRALKLAERGDEASLVALLNGLKDENLTVRCAVAEAIASLAQPLKSPQQVSRFTAPLIEALEDEDRRVRANSAKALGKLQAGTPEAITALTAALADEDYSLRTAATRALVEIGKAAVPALAEALGIGNKDVTEHAAQALAGIGPQALDALPPLVKVLSDKSATPVTRSKAAWALGEMGAGAVDAGAALKEVVLDTKADVFLRGAAAVALGKVGPKVPGAAEALISVVGVEHMRRQAIEGLGSLGPLPGVVEALITLSKHSEAEIRKAVALALRKMGGAKGAIETLMEMLKDPNPGVRYSAVYAIAELGLAAKPAIAALMQSLQDEDSSVRARAAHALGKIGPVASKAVPALEALLADEDSRVRSSASWAILKITGHLPHSGPRPNDKRSRR